MVVSSLANAQGNFNMATEFVELGRNAAGALDVEFHQNACNAFEVAARLAPTIAAIPGEKVLMAHSLGNMVCSSMIQDHGLQVSKYLMCNSAVPSEAYCGQDDISIRVPQLLHPDWESYPTNTWASNWHKHFREIPDDDRKFLGWPARFPDVPAVAVNFYSTGDEVLELYENNRIGILEGITSGWVQFCWHHQEIWKGRAFPVEGVGGTNWSGWDFDKVWIQSLTLPVRVRRYTPEDAAALTSQQIRSVPVFNPYPESITNAVMPMLVRAAHLTQGIPALAPPTGSTAYGGLALKDEMIDMNIEGEGGVPKPNGWPARVKYPGRWLLLT